MNAKKIWERETGRTYWKDDKQFLEFNNKMLKKKYSFDEILKISTFGKLDFTEKINWNNIKKEWNTLVNEWNHIENIDDRNKGYGFVGLVYLITLFPYKKLKDPGIFFEHEINVFNRVYFYHTSQCLPFQNLEDLFSGPTYPPAYQDWINEKYNGASWWITYIVWEKNNKLSHIIKDNRAKFI